MFHKISYDQFAFRNLSEYSISNYLPTSFESEALFFNFRTLKNVSILFVFFFMLLLLCENNIKWDGWAVLNFRKRNFRRIANFPLPLVRVIRCGCRQLSLSFLPSQETVYKYAHKIWRYRYRPPHWLDLTVSIVAKYTPDDIYCFSTNIMESNLYSKYIFISLFFDVSLLFYFLQVLCIFFLSSWIWCPMVGKEMRIGKWNVNTKKAK